MNELVIVMSLSMVVEFGVFRLVQSCNAITFNCAMNLHKKCNWQDGKTVWLCNIPKANIKSCYPIWKKKHASKGHIWSAKQKIQTNGHDRLLLSLLSQISGLLPPTFHYLNLKCAIRFAKVWFLSKDKKNIEILNPLNSYFQILR